MFIWTRFLLDINFSAAYTPSSSPRAELPPGIAQQALSSTHVTGVLVSVRWGTSWGRVNHCAMDSGQSGGRQTDCLREKEEPS